MSGLRNSQLLKLQQKISPQQIQFIKLLQVTTMSLDQRVKEEIEQNPALEDAGEEAYYGDNTSESQASNYDSPSSSETKTVENYETSEREVNIDEFLTSDTYDYKTRLPRSADDEEEYETPIVQMKSLYDMLMEQFFLVNMTEQERVVGENIIGNIEEDGYLRRPLRQIIADLAFRQGISIPKEVAESALEKVQQLDPPGVGATSLQECLVLQLKRKQATSSVLTAIDIITHHFEDLSKKHFPKICAKLGITQQDLRTAYDVITKLNPKPGESQSDVKHAHIVPDFILTVEEDDLVVKLNGRNAPDLKVSRSYANLYKKYKEMEKAAKDEEIKKTVEFLKNKIDSAQWFIDALKQRQYTLLYTMQSIAAKQKDFFLSGGDQRKMRPMILKDIADEIQMDISTVSRVANSKYVQTDFGIFPLKYFFSEGIETADGIVSNREIKSVLEEIIGTESKQDPLSDDIITEMLNEKGYNIARRTVAKYREQLNIPVARLRKEV